MLLKNTELLPEVTIPILLEHTQILFDSLGAKLVGVYVHGSAAMGGFNQTQSDIDYLAIISSPLTPQDRRALAEKFLAIYGKSGFKKGIEMSIVMEQYVGKDFEYPTPFEFHMGTKEQIRTFGKPLEKAKTDPDLASYFAVINERGVCIFGKDTHEVFAHIDAKYYWQSVQHDLKDTPEGIVENPMYHILNLCRSLYGLKNHRIYSKKEGADLYLAEQNEYSELVASALSEYTTGTKVEYSEAKLIAFADSTLNKIKPLLRIAADN